MEHLSPLLSSKQLTESLHDTRRAQAYESTTEPHPLRVRPSGNAMTADRNSRSNMGIFSHLPDEVVLLLLEWLDKDGLLNVGASCRALYAYATSDQLWRDLYILKPTRDFSWRGSWRSSYLDLSTTHLSSIDCRFLFSDALYRPFFCAQIPLSPYFESIPLRNQIPRLPDMSPSEFTSAWTDRPFILTQPVKHWPIYNKWCQDTLLEQFAQTIFRAEAVDWPLHTYIDYMNNNLDESPLYLFDPWFVEKMALIVGTDSGAYWPPECFGQDLFALFGDERPDHRWLIIGPERSGSTFHKDPNATSAWNAVVRGSKYWIMFPSLAGVPPPPGVFVSDDQSEVTSPLSIAEWLLTFHAEARDVSGCLEGVCGPGEVLHVPSGWWHLVVNLEHAIAITQNFVPDTHLKAALSFLKHKPDQVSGFKSGVADPYALLMERLQANRPELLVSGDRSEKKRKWEEVAQNCPSTNATDTSGFTFGFGGDFNDEEVP